MAEITKWVKKIWKNRTTEFPTRRTLMKEDGSSEIVTVTRNEGTVSEEGDAFDADTMNNLEERIDAGFAELNGKLLKVAFVSREVTVGTTNNTMYGGYYGQSHVPTLSDAGVSGTLLDVIVAYYANEYDYNITCDVKYLKNSPQFAVSSVLASQTILVVFALLYY